MAAPILKNLTFFILKHASNKNVHLCTSPVYPRLFSTQTLHPNPAVFDILVHKHHFPREFASRLASELSSVKNPKTVDSMLSFLKSSGFSIPQLQKILNYRVRFLRYSLEGTVKPKINLFQDEGFSPNDLSKIITSCPATLTASLSKTIIPSLSTLEGLLGVGSNHNAAVVRVVRLYPRILLQVKPLVANVRFLKSCGLSMHRLRIILTATPSALCYSSKAMRASVKKIQEMGLTVDSKAFIYAVKPIVSFSKENWELKLQCFRDMGFSESDILGMFRREPRVFGLSIEKMRMITEGLVATGKFDISGIVGHPASLLYSFEKRYKPRIRVLETLESRSLIENWPPLHVLSTASEAKFFERFVRPYMNEVGGVYMEEMKD